MCQTSDIIIALQKLVGRPTQAGRFHVSPSCYHLQSLHHNTTHYHTLQLLSTLEQMTKPPVLSMTRSSCPLLGHARAAPHLHTQFRTFTISRHASHSTERPTQHEKEDFYQYYLNIDRPDKNMSRILWPKQPVVMSPDLALLRTHEVMQTAWLTSSILLCGHTSAMLNGR